MDIAGAEKAIAEAQLPPESLVIEVTEDSFIAEPARARTILREIRAHRVQVAIDDYGTGFSSLSYLRDLPVQELKMDRSFIATMRSDTRSRMIVASTFQMAHALGMRTVAEGVENALNVRARELAHGFVEVEHRLLRGAEEAGE